ncbi:hypothetical protein ZWY2020_052560 [Hordeum vulgare]|nr:hypothetical protein ZWY2020_052560 [Hordeum vulgare]
MLDSDNLVVPMKKKFKRTVLKKRPVAVVTPRKSPRLVGKVASPSLGELPRSGSEAVVVTPRRSHRVLAYAKPSPPIGSSFSAQAKRCGVNRRGATAKVNKGCKKRSRVDADGQDVVDEDSHDACVDQCDSTPPKPLEDGFYDDVMRLKAKLSYKRSCHIKTNELRNILKDLVKDEKNDDLALQVFYVILFMQVGSPGTSTCVSSEAAMAENLVSQDMSQLDYCVLLVDDLKRAVIRYQQVAFEVKAPRIVSSQDAPAGVPDEVPRGSSARMKASAGIYSEATKCSFDDASVSLGRIEGLLRIVCGEIERVPTTIEHLTPVDDILPPDSGFDAESSKDALSIKAEILAEIRQSIVHLRTSFGMFKQPQDARCKPFKDEARVVISQLERPGDVDKGHGRGNEDHSGEYIADGGRDDNNFAENASARVEEPALASNYFVARVDDTVAKFKRFVGFLEEVYGKAEYKTSKQPNSLSIAKRPTYVKVAKQGANECGFFRVKFCFTYDGDGLTEDFGDLDCPGVDDWEAEFMYTLVFTPKNEIMREELPAEIRELEQ